MIKPKANEIRAMFVAIGFIRFFSRALLNNAKIKMYKTARKFQQIR
jgi:hypothetical protein